jgi:O-antigen ligase
MNPKLLGLNIIRFFKSYIFEISISLCFLLPPFGITLLFILSFSTIYRTFKAKKQFNFSLLSVFLICLFLATVGAVFQMHNLSLLIGSVMMLGYWGIYQRIISSETPKNFKYYQWIVILGGLYNCLIGYINNWAFTHPIIGFLTGTILIGDKSTGNYGRLIGSAYNPNFTMYLLLLSMAFIFAKMLNHIQKKQYAVLSLFIPMLIVLSIGVIETGSRAGFITMICIYALFFIRLNKVIFITVSVVIICLIKPIFNLMPRNTSIDGSFLGREQIWMNSLDIWGHHPLFGTTPYGFRQEYMNLFGKDVPHSHDIFIGFFAEYGILGGLSFLILLAVTVYKCVNLFFYKEKNKGLLDSFLLSLPIIVFTGVLDEPNFTPQLGVLTIILLGYWGKYSSRFKYSYPEIPVARMKGAIGKNIIVTSQNFIANTKAELYIILKRVKKVKEMK